ncbi:unnamed protein product, partial [Musa acuminata subsp. burmannicoides]
MRPFLHLALCVTPLVHQLPNDVIFRSLVAARGRIWLWTRRSVARSVNEVLVSDRRGGMSYTGGCRRRAGHRVT